MAIRSNCPGCGAETFTSASDRFRRCDNCKRKTGWRPQAEIWAEMTPEQKIEDLNQRLLGVERDSHWDGRIG